MNPSYFVNVSQSEPGLVNPARHSVRYDDFVNKLLKPDSIKMTALHIGLGIAGEALEFVEALDSWYNNWSAKPDPEAITHLIEELGDLEFYMQAAQTFYGVTDVDAREHATVTVNSAQPIITTTYLGILAESGNLSDLIKKEFIYGKPREIKLILTAMYRLRSHLLGMYHAMSTERAHVLQCNALKLETRYAGLVYSAEAAIARADKPHEST